MFRIKRINIENYGYIGFSRFKTLLDVIRYQGHSKVGSIERYWVLRNSLSRSKHVSLLFPLITSCRSLEQICSCILSRYPICIHTYEERKIKLSLCNKVGGPKITTRFTIKFSLDNNGLV